MPNIKKSSIEDAIKNSFGIKARVYGQLAIDHRTLDKYLKKWPDLLEQLEVARMSANDFVESSMFKRIKAGSDAMIIFYLKTRMNYKETQRLEHTVKMTLEQEYERAKKHFEGQKKCKSGNVIVNTLEENSSEQ